MKILVSLLLLCLFCVYSYAFDLSGDLFINDYQQRHVISYDAFTGELNRRYYAPQITYPMGMAFINTPAGRNLVVLDGEQKSRLLFFSIHKTGTMFLRKRIDLGVFGIGLTLSPIDPHNPSKERTIFVAAPRVGKILQIYPSSKSIEAFATGHESCTPTDLAFDPTVGDLFVTCFTSHSVVRFDGVTGDFIETLISNIQSPTGITFGPCNTANMDLFVASSEFNSITRYGSVDGRFLGEFVPLGTGGLISPLGIRFSPFDSNLYATTASGAILKYDGQTGDFIDRIGSAGLKSPSYFVWDTEDECELRDGLDGEFEGNNLYDRFIENEDVYEENEPVERGNDHRQENDDEWRQIQEDDNEQNNNIDPEEEARLQEEELLKQQIKEQEHKMHEEEDERRRIVEDEERSREEQNWREMQEERDGENSEAKLTRMEEEEEERRRLWEELEEERRRLWEEEDMIREDELRRFEERQELEWLRQRAAEYARAANARLERINPIRERWVRPPPPKDRRGPRPIRTDRMNMKRGDVRAAMKNARRNLGTAGQRL